MKKILITGGAGFIPSCLADYLLRDTECQITLVDNLLTGKASNIPNSPRVRFIKCDVNNFSDISSVMVSGSFDYVFHFAAVVGVKRTLENPLMVFKDIEGIRNILDLSKNTGVKKVLYSSSSEVYGEPVELPQREHSTPLNSKLPYAIVKNVGESFCKSYFQEFGLPFTVFRFFNTYGPKQSEDFVISKFIAAAFRNADITIYGDGLQSRTFCYINDNIEFVSQCLFSDYLLNDVVNVGSDKVYTIKDVAELIIKLTSSKSTIVHQPALKEGDMTKRQPDISKMKRVLNRPLIDLQEGLFQTIKFMKEGFNK